MTQLMKTKRAENIPVLSERLVQVRTVSPEVASCFTIRALGTLVGVHAIYSKLRVLVDTDAIVAIGKWSVSSNALSSSSHLGCATISSYVSRRAILTYRFNFGGDLA